MALDPGDPAGPAPPAPGPPVSLAAAASGAGGVASGSADRSQAADVSLSKRAAGISASVSEKLAQQQEDSRSSIALLIVGSLAFIVVAAFVTLWTRGKHTPIDDITRLVQALIGPVAGIVGAVTGFYFGANHPSGGGGSGGG